MLSQGKADSMLLFDNNNHKSKTVIDISASLQRLKSHVEDQDFNGYDPYDALNSRIFEFMPFLQNRFGRLVLIQTMKRNPFNIRPILRVPKSQNPKGIALFSSALLKLLDLDMVSNNDTLSMLTRLIDLRSPNTPYYCWGYNFDWQQRVLLVPKFTPNIICTTFAGNALLDAHEKYDDSSYLEMALSAGDFILNGLNIKKMEEGICFSYTPLDHSQVHNANLLGSAFLARLYKITGRQNYFDYALKSAEYSVSRQNNDGSWYYGENAKQKWIDNFHTGYNLVALNRYRKYTGNEDFNGNIEKGFNFYKNNFFMNDGVAKYYHNKVYPIDIHSIAQSIITLIELKELDRNNIDFALSICRWGIENMQDKDGYFYYQKKLFYTNKISYMRWSQAWMLYALAILLNEISL